jgi:hypothetical protein
MGTWNQVICLFLLTGILKLKPFVASKRSPHVIDVTCQDGLLDMISLGCLIEFSIALDSRLYADPEESIPDDERDEIDATQARYRRFITWYQDRFFLVIEGQYINPAYIFHRRLLDFASTLILYVRSQRRDFHRAAVDKHNLTEDSLTKHLVTQINLAWPDLKEAFFEIRKSPNHRLYYDGPAFEIRVRPQDWKERFAALGLVERNEWSQAPLQVSALKALARASHDGSDDGEDEMDIEEDSEDEEGQEGTGNGSDASSALSGLSTSSSEATSSASVAPKTVSKTPSTPRRPKRTRQLSSSTPKSPSSSHKAKRQR